MESLTISDVLNFAVRIEEIGELFYRKAALIVSGPEEVTLFHRLAEEEIRHKEIFKEMLKKAGGEIPPESYPGEYFKYLRGFIDGKVIFKEGVKDLIEEIKDTKSALDFAIQRELDSILFYHEIRELVLETQKKMVNEIIREERKHFEILSQIRKKYDQ